MEMETPGPEPVPATTCWVAFGKSPLASVKRKVDAVFPTALLCLSDADHSPALTRPTHRQVKVVCSLARQALKGTVSGTKFNLYQLVH